MTESYENEQNDWDELMVSMISSRDIAIANRDKVPTGFAMCAQRHVRLELCLILASFAPLAKLGCPTRPLVLSLRKHPRPWSQVSPHLMRCARRFLHRLS
jgi:hypothetical protein